MLKLLGAFVGGLLLCACSAQALDTGEVDSGVLVTSTDPPSTDLRAVDAPVATPAFYQQHCGICHLEAGQGVPGAFPPLGQRLSTWGANQAGQAYLASVIANGLFGVLQVNGQQYAGAMPGLAGRLTHAEIAGLLNYVLVEFAGGSAVFSAQSIGQHLATVGAGPSLPLRPE